MLGPQLNTDRFATRGVDGWWSGLVHGDGVVVPDAAVDLMYTPGVQPWLAGPDTKPRPVTLTKGTTVVGVRLRPGAVQALLNESTASLADQGVELGVVLARDVVDKIVESVESATTEAAAAMALACAIGELLPLEWSPDPIVLETVSQLRHQDDITDIALSERQLRRRFVQAMGFGPAFYRRIARLDRFSRLLSAAPQFSNSQLAAHAGYFDEAHLWRDATALTGDTPSQMRAQVTG